jgi:XTP/dITP diphosphohydrolase
MMEIVIASTNRGKIQEFRQMLEGWEGIRVSDLSQREGLPVVEETGHTFLANACLKASGYARILKKWCLADDSGLAVDALGGKPGVLSARWAAVNHAGEGDTDNNALLLKQLAGVPAEKKTARFICALALADERGTIVMTASGAVEGRILEEARGEGGFGYDPLFLIDALGKTTAELPAGEKHRVSHRGQALRRLAEVMGRGGIIADCRLPNAEF